MRNILLILILFASLICAREASAQTVTLKTDSVSIDCASSDTFLVPIRVFNFNSIGSFQFTLMWDTSRLDYIYTTPLNPVFLGNGIDVGFDTTTFINQGKITFIWTNSNGGTAPDSSVVFSLAFTRTGGPFAPLMFVNSPAVVEVANESGDILPVMLMPGGVQPIDDEAPAITCPADVTVQGNGPTPVNGIAPNSISDNCAPVASVGWSSSGATVADMPDDPDASGANFNVGSSTVTYTATDVGGNTATCSFTVEVELSNTSDTLTIIAANASTSCNQTVSIDITALNFDSLGSLQFSLGWDFSVLQYSSVSNFNPALQLLASDFGTTQTANGLLTFLWTTDAAQGTSLPDGAVLFTINLNVIGTGGANSGIVFGDVPSIREAVSNASGSPEEIPAIWINGTVNVVDDFPPILACPDNVAVDLPNGNVNVMVNGLEPTALQDNCGGTVALNYATTGATTGQGTGNANGTYNPGVTTVTYTATDQAGNTSTCSFTVTVNAAGLLTLMLDTVAVDCQGAGSQIAVNLTVENWDDIVGLQFSVNWDQTVLQFDTVSNDFPGLNLTGGDFNFNTAPNGTFSFFAGGPGSNWPQIPDGGIFFTIYFTVLDPASTSNIGFTGFIEAINSGINTVPVTTIGGFFQPGADMTPPAVTCPADITVDAVANECNANVMVPLPTADDPCSGIDSIIRTPAGDVFNAGITTVIYTVTDSAGNSATCSMMITVVDNNPPEFLNCPTGVTDVAPGFACETQVTWTPPTAIDACGQTDLTVVSNFTPDSIFPVGQTLVLYTVTDITMNTASCSFLVTVQDTAAPVIVCPSDFTVSPDGSPGCTAVVQFAVTAFDNCDQDVELNGTVASNTVFQPGNTQVMYEAIDDFNNTSSCLFVVTVLDDSIPTVVCPEDIVVTASQDTCGAFPDWTDATATDDCSGVLTPTSTVLSGSFFPVGNTVVTYTAVDDAGNEGTCSFQVTVTEDVPPIILGCPNSLLLTLPPNTCDTIIFWDVPAATDNCSTPDLTTDIPPGSVFPAGVTIVTYTATDFSGNTSTCTFSISAIDQIAPVLSACPPNVTVNDASPCGEVVSWDLPTATDNCTPDSALIVASIPQSGSLFFNGTTEVVCFVQDASGNYDSCTFEVKIVATQQPGFVNVPEDITVEGCAQTPASWNPPTPVGFCVVDTLYSNYMPGDSFPLGTTVVSYTAIDSTGSITTATFAVTVTENEPPQIDCPESPVVLNVGGAIISDPDFFIFSADTVASCDGVRLEFDMPAATDNCGIASFTQIGGGLAGGVFPIGTDTISYEAIDSSGNTMMCSVVITVQGLTPLNAFSNPALGCVNQSVTLTADSIPGANYIWSGPQGPYANDNQIVVTGFGTNTEGLYTVFAEVNGCPTPLDSVTLELATAPDAIDDTNIFIAPGTTDTFNILSNDVLIPFSDFSITQVGALEGLTSLGNGLFSYESPLEGGEASFLYEVCSKSCPNLCDMALVTILALNVEDCSFIPNVITPNGDLVNDWLEIPCLNSGMYRDNSLVIYNQWGDKVFEATPYDNDPAIAWRGTFDGEPGKDLPDGVYYYIFKPGPNEPVIKGFVEIFR
ncbi:MAG: HYR domain-containing protein [Lewinellaceae bacterium]|nr:HYR domain-containing protein [Lewinellaceae bacterium]